MKSVKSLATVLATVMLLATLGCAITTKVKTKLAAKHMSTLTKIQPDTDRNGAVWLSGRAPTQDAKDLAGMITKDTDGVTAVHNNIVVE